MFKQGDKVIFYDNMVDHLNGKKGEIVALHKDLNCVTISYNHKNEDGLLIQVNNCQCVKVEK
jgi:hypothetical protein